VLFIAQAVPDLPQAVPGRLVRPLPGERLLQSRLFHCFDALHLQLKPTDDCAASIVLSSSALCHVVTTQAVDAATLNCVSLKGSQGAPPPRRSSVHPIPGCAGLDGELTVALYGFVAFAHAAESSNVPIYKILTFVFAGVALLLG
jgi:hypothetical protein